MFNIHVKFMRWEREVMSDQVRVGIIGTSWWSDLMYLPILSQYERAEVVAICGRNRERAQEMADKYSIPKVFSDYRQMIEAGACDAIVVATPDDTHYEMTMTTLDAGLHVLCEKPVALNADHARQMYEKAEAARVKHMVMFTARWFPNYRYVKQLIDSDYLGQPYHAHLRHVGGYGRPTGYSWRFDGERSHGILGDLGSHLIDRARWYLGDVTSVSAHLASFVQHVDSDNHPVKSTNDSAILTLECASGAQAILHISGVAHVGSRGQEHSNAVHGTLGTVETPFDLGSMMFQVYGLRHDEDQFREMPIPADMLAGITAQNPLGMFWGQSVGPRLFIDSILDDQPIEPGLYEGYKVQQVIDAALKSHETGQRITMPQ